MTKNNPLEFLIEPGIYRFGRENIFYRAVKFGEGNMYFFGVRKDRKSFCLDGLDIEEYRKIKGGFRWNFFVERGLVSEEGLIGGSFLYIHRRGKSFRLYEDLLQIRREIANTNGHMSFVFGENRVNHF